MISGSFRITKKGKSAMRLIIGIILGVLIVFNWTTIRDMFDSSIAKQSDQQTDTSKSIDGKGEAAVNPPAQQPQPAQPQSVSELIEQQMKAAADRK
jgi:predicted negative regulator of RcsB-dependent stress response